MSYDYREVYEIIKKFIVDRLQSSNSSCIIIGISGGLDSSVALRLAVDSIGKDKVIPIMMPETAITPEIDIEDAQILSRQLKIDIKTMYIDNIKSEYLRNLPKHVIAEGNLSSRIRMSILYHFARVMNGLVIGTSDKSELLLGYFTKFGDGGADFFPLGGLYKSEIREFAKFLLLPSRIYLKKSGPRLWKDHEAETELGMSYTEIDKMLDYLNNPYDKWDVVHKPLILMNLNNFKKTLSIIDNTKHKREGFTICNIGPKYKG